jgi:hypothetical protein
LKTLYPPAGQLNINTLEKLFSGRKNVSLSKEIAGRSRQVSTK